MMEEIGQVVADVAARFRLSRSQVEVAVDLLKQGESVPFIVRYQKLKTGGMKKTPLRQLRRHLDIEKAHKARLTRKLEHEAALKAKQPEKPLHVEQLLMREIEENGSIFKHLRDKLWEEGVLSSVVLPEKKVSKKSKKPKRRSSQVQWAEYAFDRVLLQNIPARKLHMLLRGRREQALSLHIAFSEPRYGEEYLASKFPKGPAPVLQTLWQKKIFPMLEVELLAQLKNRSDDEMIHGLSKQLQGLLLGTQSPQGVVMGLFSEGVTTGIAVVDEKGLLLDACSIFPLAPEFRWHDAITTLAKYIARHQVSLVALGNGTNLAEFKRLFAGVVARYPDMPFDSFAVDESGLPSGASAEQGAVSIARRFQDPMLELARVPIDKLQLGELQEEVNPKRLVMSLAGVMEDAVNEVGVDVNTAPDFLLAYVSGFDADFAKKLVQFREVHGPFESREALKAVPDMSDERFRQAAGFLRVSGGANPLDATRLHPNDYARLDELDTLPSDEQELLTKQRAIWKDPRPKFKKPQFDEQIETIRDLKVGMSLEGVVTRISSFGVFVDVGIQPLGLVHISELGTRFVRTPYEVLKVGDVVQVQVLQVDSKKRRIAFGMRTEEKPSESLEISKKKRKNKIVNDKPTPVVMNTAMADAFAKLKRGLS